MSSEDLKLTPEEALKNEERKKWLEEHPFTKKWLDTCPGDVGRPSPVYERPKMAEIINGTEKIDMEKAMSKEIKIEKQCDPRDIYVAENNKNPEREAVEQRMKKMKESIRAKYGNIEPGEFVEGQVPVGTKFNGIEVVKPQTGLNEYEDDSDIFETKRPGSVLKEYAKDKKREEIKRDMSKYIMNDQEEEKIKNMLHLKETKKDNDAVVPGDFDGICRDLMALHARKNKDYGNAADASYREFGLVSYVIRLNDKMNRLKSLTKPGVEQEVKSESIEDTLMDLAAYAIMAIESLRS
jgi:hypothetical protein